MKDRVLEELSRAAIHGSLRTGGLRFGRQRGWGGLLGASNEDFLAASTIELELVLGLYPNRLSPMGSRHYILCPSAPLYLVVRFGGSTSRESGR